MLGLIEGTTGQRAILDKPITDVINAAKKIPLRTIRVIGLRNGAKRERPAIADVVGRRGIGSASIGATTGIDQRQLRRKTAGAGGHLQGIAVGKLP